MNTYQVKKFYETKKDFPCPITRRLVNSGYIQPCDREGYTKTAKEQEITNPSQWWHLIELYCDQTNMNKQFPKTIQCGELLVWMAEVAECVSISELNYIVNLVLENKESRSIGNKLIQDMCFDKIVSKVESSVPLHDNPINI